MESLGINPHFPGYGKIYRSNGFIIGDTFGGPDVIDWLKENFEAKDDDTYVVSFPKTGTTWAQEIVYVIANDLDIKKAKSASLAARFPYMELKYSIDEGFMNNLKSPRFIKSHYPYSLLPESVKDKKCKIVYILRNPKDTIVSYYYFMKLKKLYVGDNFEEFFNLCIEENGKVAYTPIWKHYLEFWNRRHEENILILFYEDMKIDLIENVHKVANFLGKKLTDEQAKLVANHCTFDSMKTNPTTNFVQQFGKGEIEFMRKGEIGDWKNHFNENMNKKMEKYVEKYFSGSGLEFIYE